MFNIPDMMGKMQEMQKRMDEAREKLAEIVVEAEAGGGMVRVIANGKKQVLKVIVDPDIIDKEDPEIMSDLIVAAVNKALQQAETQGAEAMREVSKDMLPNIPGLDLGKLGLG